MLNSFFKQGEELFEQYIYDRYYKDFISEDEYLPEETLTSLETQVLDVLLILACFMPYGGAFLAYLGMFLLAKNSNKWYQNQIKFKWSL